MSKIFQSIILVSCLFTMQINALPLFAASRGLTVVSKEGKSIGLYNDYHAVVIGVSDYDHWPDLPSAVKDAQEVRTQLEKMGFTVSLVLDPDAQKLSSILTHAYYDLGREKERALLIYFAGHGATTELADGTTMGYIIPKDCPLQDKNRADFDNKAISMMDIEKIALQIKSRHVLMVFDSCFSGDLFTLVRDKPTPYIEEKVCYPVRQFITAGNKDEKMPDKSVFKEVFIQGIKDRFADVNKDGYVTVEELGFYFQEQVVNYSDGRQHPQFGRINDAKLDKGDFVFHLWPGESEPSQPPAAPDGHGESWFNVSECRHMADEHEAVRNIRNKWDQLLSTIRANYEKLVTFDKDDGVPPKIKASAWKVFLSKSGVMQNNPYSEEDDTMRKHAEKLIAHWELEEERISERLKEESTKPVEKQGYVGSQETETTASGKEWKDPITGMKFVWVPGGSFGMGDLFGDGEVNEKHIRTVRLDGFWLGKYEVTQGEWHKIVGSNPSYFKKRDYYPVECVSWNDAQEFIKKLNSTHNGRYTFRLPSEAEWEYAARSGGKKEKWAGTSSGSSLGLYAWYVSNSRGETHPVGQKQSNGLRLYDMSGNVWEWCEDVYSDYSKVGTDNPIYKGSGSYRVFRGGGWNCPPGVVRASYRGYFTPDFRGYILGFRLARTP